MTPNAFATPTPVQPQSQPATPHLKAEGKYTTGADHRGQATPVAAVKPGAVASPGCAAPGADRSIPLVDEKKPVGAPKA